MGVSPATVSSATTVYNQTQRNAVSPFWPDGLIGALSKSGSDYTAFGASGDTSTLKTIRTVGPLSDPAHTVTSITISSVPAFANYASFGAVGNLDAGTQNLWGVVHFERWPLGDASHFWASLGIAKSTDGGSSWACLATDLLTVSWPYDPSATTFGQDITGGPIAPFGLYYHCYYREYPTISTAYMSVARCLQTTWNSAILAGTLPPMDKWQGGNTWGGSNLGAQLNLDPLLTWGDMWIDTDTGVGVYFGTHNIATPTAQCRCVQTVDGLNFLNTIPISTETVGSGEGVIYASAFPTTITGVRSGTGPFTVYYSFGPRWTNNELHSRTVTFVPQTTFIFDEGGRQLSSGGSVNWASDTIMARLVDASVVVARSATVMTGLTAIGTDATLSGKTLTKDVLTHLVEYGSASPTITSPGTGSTYGCVVIYKKITDDSDSIPLFCGVVPAALTDGTDLLLAVPAIGWGTT